MSWIAQLPSPLLYVSYVDYRYPQHLRRKRKIASRLLVPRIKFQQDYVLRIAIGNNRPPQQIPIPRFLDAQPKPRLSIWLDIGTKEGLDTLEDARELRDVLEQRGWIEGTDLKYTEARNEIHDEAAWAARVAPMLEFLFPG